MIDIEFLDNDNCGNNYMKFCIELASGQKVYRFCSECTNCDGADNWEDCFYTDEFGNRINDPDLTDAEGCKQSTGVTIVKHPICYEAGGMIYKGWEIEGIDGDGNTVFRRAVSADRVNSAQRYQIVDCPCSQQIIQAPQAVNDEGKLLIYGRLPAEIVQVALNDILCGNGQTTDFRLKIGSEINVIVTPQITPTGDFSVTPVNTGAWSFEYDIYCDGVYSGQTATVSGTTTVGIAATEDYAGYTTPGTPLTIDTTINDTLCSPGVTTWQVVAGSEVNLIVIDNPIDTDGVFDITPLSDGNFEFYYELICDGVPSGEIARVYGQAVTPSISLQKIADVQGLGNEGDTITYTFIVTNDGTADLTNIVVTDPLIPITGGPISLLAGQTDSTTFTAIYTITAADILAGQVVNQATVTGTPPGGLPDVSDLSDDPADLTGDNDPTVVIVPESAIEILKAATLIPGCDPAAPSSILPTDDGVTPAGFGVAPTGWSILIGTTDISDVNAWGGDPDYAWIGAPVAMPPSGHNLWVSGYRDERVGTTISGLVVGQEYTFNFSYGLFAPVYPTAGDGEYYYRSPEVDILLDGVLFDQFTISGNPGDSQPLWAEHELTFTATDTTMELAFQNGPAYRAFNGTPANPAYAWNVSFDSFICKVEGYESIEYTFTVTNTGTVDLTNVIVTDPLVTVSGGPIPLLPAGTSDSTTFTATYTITEADRTAGTVTNQATVTGTNPDTLPVVALSNEVTISVIPPPPQPGGNYDNVDLCNHFDNNTFAALFDGNTTEATTVDDPKDHRLHQNCLMTWEFITPYTTNDSIQVYWSNAQQAANGPDDIIGIDILVSDDGGATFTVFPSPTELLPNITGDQVFDITPNMNFNWMAVRSILTEDVGADPYLWEITISNIPNV